MTSTTDTAGHPDVAELSDLTEGLLPPFRSAELQRHLDGCTLCADTHASLEEVRDLLGTFAAEPVAMPDDVALRIDAALAAEAAEMAAEMAAEAVAAAGASDVSRETPGAAPTAGVDVSRETSAADRPSGHARTASTGPGRKEKTKGVHKDRPRSRRRTAAVLGVFTAAALGLGSVLLSSLMDDGDGGSANTASDTISKGSLAEDVSKLFPRHRSLPSGSPKGEVGIQGTVESPQVLQAVNVPPCVQKGTARTEDALAVKDGVYEGRDVLLVVFPHTGDSGRVDVYVVDSACEQHPSAPADVLLKGTYARP